MVDQTGKSPVPSLVKVGPSIFVCQHTPRLLYFIQVQPLLKKGPKDVENHSTSVVRWIIWIGENKYFGGDIYDKYL